MTFVGMQMSEMFQGFRPVIRPPPAALRISLRKPASRPDRAGVAPGWTIRHAIVMAIP